MLKHKDKVFTQFMQWKAITEKQTRKKIKWLKTDNELQFCSSEFNKFCKNEGNVKHQTIKHTRQQKGVVEHINLTLLERTSNSLYVVQC